MQKYFWKNNLKAHFLEIKQHPLVRKQINVLKDSYFAKYLFPKFFAQSGEDSIIFQLLGNKKIGSYVDIGSGRPIWYSNTYFFYLKGWSGIVIDPIRHNLKLHKFQRPRDIRIIGAIGGISEQKIFFEFDTYTYSTFDENQAQKLLNAGVKLKSKYPVQISTLDSVLKNYELSSPVILNLDIEGFEFEVLKSNNFSKFKPQIICVEELINPIENKSEIRELMRENSYKLYAYTGLSSIYVEKEFLREINGLA